MPETLTPTLARVRGLGRATAPSGSGAAASFVGPAFTDQRR